MSRFDQWKARLEAEATAHDNPDAVYDRLVQADSEARRLVFDSMMLVAETYFDQYPEEEALQMTLDLIEMKINRAIAECQKLIRQYPGETDALLDYWQMVVDFYKGLVETLKEGMQA